MFKVGDILRNIKYQFIIEITASYGADYYNYRIISNSHMLYIGKVYTFITLTPGSWELYSKEKRMNETISRIENRHNLLANLQENTNNV